MMQSPYVDVKDKSTLSDKAGFGHFWQVRSVCMGETVPKAIFCSDQRFLNATVQDSKQETEQLRLFYECIFQK